MAVASEQNNTLSVQHSVEIVFVDEDDLPLANHMEHVQSDDSLDEDFELVQDFDQPTGPRIELEDMKPVEFFSAVFYRRVVESYSGPDQFIPRTEERA